MTVRREARGPTQDGSEDVAATAFQIKSTASSSLYDFRPLGFMAAFC
ncbi:hypothetical protein APTSU1_000873200 [Apodemus speciosus]|uniref:Uncharacterized protein n=1 Tax=Apodemus speciosus TaxID=105296 RepID=A0ABQ0F2J6_APOSI